jgi:hypothetical protein
VNFWSLRAQWENRNGMAKLATFSWLFSPPLFKPRIENHWSMSMLPALYQSGSLVLNKVHALIWPISRPTLNCIADGWSDIERIKRWNRGNVIWYIRYYRLAEKLSHSRYVACLASQTPACEQRHEDSNLFLSYISLLARTCGITAH